MTQNIKTQVAIIGGGPAGLLLCHILGLEGIDAVVLERQSKDYVLQRIRAGVLENGTVQLLRDVGLGERMDAKGHPHDSLHIAWRGYKPFAIETLRHTGKKMMAYGQTQITEDLYEALEEADAHVVTEAEDVQLHDLTSDAPSVTYRKDGTEYRLECAYVAGCDGFHGVSRQSIPADILKTFERIYPFGWLGVMSRTPPLPDIMYAHHPDRGFALASQRSPTLSRYYIQCAVDEDIDAWSDDLFWDELRARFPDDIASQIVTGPTIEKSIAPLRSFVAEPMQYGRLFLAGDAAHIVPPTGAKGLNLAVSDVFYLSRALKAMLKSNDASLLESYSDTALKRVWTNVRISWWLTGLLHVFPEESDFDKKIRANDFHHLRKSQVAQAALAEQVVGVPFDY